VSRRTFTGKEIVRALQKWDFQVIPGGGKGSHVKMRYVDPNTDEKRTVIVPQHGELPTGTLQDTEDETGALNVYGILAQFINSMKTYSRI
jgi:predicted RNA binding protein YcfA (HicA-like mRNA interferase family)